MSQMSQQLLYHSGEAHECHGEDADGDESNRNALEGLRNIIHCKLLPHSGEENHYKSIAE